MWRGDENHRIIIVSLFKYHKCCRNARLIIIILPSMIMAASYHPSQVQLVTCSTNKMIDYWETVDGSLIRSLQGSEVAAVNCVDFVHDGRHFVTGGADQIVKVKGVIKK